MLVEQAGITPVNGQVPPVEVQSVDLDQLLRVDVLEQLKRDVKQIACAVQRLQHTLQQAWDASELPSTASAPGVMNETAYFGLLETDAE